MPDEKFLDLSQTVHALAAANPEIVPIMAELGFSDIVKPGMLNTAGRFMTLAKGAKMKKIPLAEVINRFEAAGYTIIRMD